MTYSGENNLPPLLREMTKLADRGFCTLPATPDQPRMHVVMHWLAEIDKEPFIGGAEFMLLRIPDGQYKTVVPKPEPRLWFEDTVRALPDASALLYPQEMYSRYRYGVTMYDEPRFRGDMWVMDGSYLERRLRDKEPQKI